MEWNVAHRMFVLKLRGQVHPRIYFRIVEIYDPQKTCLAYINFDIEYAKKARGLIFF